MPINWIEAKLVNIRKNAIESNQSISIDRDDIKAFILDEKEIIFKCTNSVTQNTKIINSYLHFEIYRLIDILLSAGFWP